MASNYVLETTENDINEIGAFSPAGFRAFFRGVSLMLSAFSTAWRITYGAAGISGALLSSTVVANSADQSLEGKTITLELEVVGTHVLSGTRVSPTLDTQRIRIVSGYVLLELVSRKEISSGQEYWSNDYDKGYAFKMGEEIDALTDRLSRQHYVQKDIEYKFAKHTAKFENGELSLSVSGAYVYNSPENDWIYYISDNTHETNWVIDIAGDSCTLKSYSDESRDETKSKHKKLRKAKREKDVYIVKYTKYSCHVS